QSPISIPSTLFPPIHSTNKTESNLTSFNNNFIKSDDLYQTSNALAQLARLSSTKRYTKDNNYSFIINSMNNYINNNNDSNHSNYELNNTPNINISSNMTTNIMNNRIQSPNYNNFILNNEQLFKYKETNNLITNKDTHEKFSYQLAQDNNESVNPLCINNERRTLEWLTSTNLIHRQHTMEQLNPITNHNVTTTTNTFPCLLCGQIFHGHTELCMHVYTHLLAFNSNDAKKSNSIEDNMRLLHCETNQLQNNRSNGLLIGSKNDHSFMPFLFPPSPSQLTRSNLSMTTINTPTTVCSVNYNNNNDNNNNNNNSNNNVQSHPINGTDHPFNPSDLFQSYLSQWIRSFSSPNSNNQLNDIISHNQSSNLPWIPTDNTIMNKSIDYKAWQNILTTAYLYSLKDTTTTGTIKEQIPTTITNSNFLTSIPLQNSLHKNDNPNYYDIFLGSKPFITPFPQS
ncbi:unnamed protein product, partial [Schistosoma curassoni]|uniref:C2H2-type domain-containing protein n=1 Tax=Schistosoma curassoni TaxID=6186 RepID=A0A183L7D5_9TREM